MRDSASGSVTSSTGAVSIHAFSDVVLEDRNSANHLSYLDKSAVGMFPKISLGLDDNDYGFDPQVRPNEMQYFFFLLFAF